MKRTNLDWFIENVLVPIAPFVAVLSLPVAMIVSPPQHIPRRVEMGAWIVELGTCTDGPVYRQTLIVKGPNGTSVFYSPEPNP